MKSSSLVLVLSFCLSAMASGGNFVPSTKYSKKISKYCFKGDIKNLEKMKIKGYLPERHGYGNENNQTPEDILNNQEAGTISILSGMSTSGYIDAAPLVKCYDWMLKNNGVVKPDYIFEVQGGPVTFYDLGVIAKLFLRTLEYDETQTLTTDMAVIFARDYGYKTDQLYDDDFGGTDNCELSFAVNSSYSLKNIKKLVAAGYAKNPLCLRNGIESAVKRELPEIEAFLKSI